MLSALYTIARPSVRLSVTRLISQKRLKLGLCNFQLRLATYLVSGVEIVSLMPS